jgi:hypothetical protein
MLGLLSVALLGAASIRPAAPLGVVRPPGLRAPAVAVPSAPVPLATQLAALAKEHYYPMAMAQMCFVRVSSDVFAQWYSAYHDVPLRWLHTVVLECSASGCSSQFLFDFGHLAAMGLAGITTSGLGGALWLRYLESRLGPTDGATDVAVSKCVADYVCWGSTVNAANLLLVPLVCGHSFDASMTNMHANWLNLMQLELLLFGPFNLLIFSRADLIPIELRPTVKAMLSFVFSVGLSVACA